MGDNMSSIFRRENITKSGSINWARPLCYNTSTNRYNSVLSGSISYDNNGNLKNDTFHTYSWDADGRMVSVDAAPVTYDAFGRMAEANNSSQFLYLAGGEKPFAQMSGSTLGLSFVPLPGGGFAVYTSSGILNYSHADEGPVESSPRQQIVAFMPSECGGVVIPIVIADVITLRHK